LSQTAMHNMKAETAIKQWKKTHDRCQNVGNSTTNSHNGNMIASESPISSTITSNGTSLRSWPLSHCHVGIHPRLELLSVHACTSQLDESLQRIKNSCGTFENNNRRLPKWIRAARNGRGESLKQDESVAAQPSFQKRKLPLDNHAQMRLSIHCPFLFLKSTVN
jgi:hypothetical protein